jgi:hypothetical protein
MHMFRPDSLAAFAAVPLARPARSARIRDAAHCVGTPAEFQDALDQPGVGTEATRPTGGTSGFANCIRVERAVTDRIFADAFESRRRASHQPQPPRSPFMTASKSRRFPTAFAVALIAFAAPSFAADNDSAKGKLILQSEDKPVSVELMHAYYITGPDQFDPKKTTRRIIFASEDVRAGIDACDEASCAMHALNDGMTIEMDDTSSMRYWAHVRPMQYSGMLERSALALGTDRPDRLAGTVKLANSGVTTTIVFDATLVKAFGPEK